MAQPPLLCSPCFGCSLINTPWSWARNASEVALLAIKLMRY